MIHNHSHTHDHSAHEHGPSCACGHDHDHAPAPKLAAPLSLISSGSPARLSVATVAIVALWAVTWWALSA